MAFYRIFPTKDTFVTNLATSIGDASASNAGASEILQLFKFGPSGSLGVVAESGSKSHVLVAFDTSSFPHTGTQYWLRLADAQHAETLPYDYTVDVIPVEQFWAEGKGHDIDFFTDQGVANWLSASTGVAWATVGGRPSGTLSASFYFTDGHEDLLLDVTTLVPSASAYGYFVGLRPSAEADTLDYFLKEFHSRQTHFLTKRPYLESRWVDWTGTLTSATFYVVTSGTQSGSVLSGNVDQSLYQSTVTGSFSGTVLGTFTGRFVTGSPGEGLVLGTTTGTITGGTGSSNFDGTLSGTLTGSAQSGSVSGTFSGTLYQLVSTLSGVLLPTAALDPTGTIVSAMYDLKPVYDSYDYPRLRLYTRMKDWNLATVPTATLNASGTVLRDAYYRVVDERSGEELVPFGTGALPYTKLSFDDNGNFFDVAMASLPTGTLMRFDFLYRVSGTWFSIPGDDFTFRVR